MLGGGVRRRIRPRRVRRNRAVVDDAPAHRLLVLHQLERLLGAEKRAGEIDVDDVLPLFVGKLVQVDRRRADAGIVEQQVEVTKSRLCLGEELAHRAGIADIGGNDQRARPRKPGLRDDLLEGLASAPCQGDAIALVQQTQCDGFADTGTGTGDNSGFDGRGHAVRSMAGN